MEGCGGPEGGEGEEEGYEGEGVGGHGGDGGEVLEDGEDCCGWEDFVSKRDNDGCWVCYVPGIIRVWQPMMKMICMGPKRLRPSFLRSFRAKASLVTNTAQNQQMLIEVVILLALSSQLREVGGSSEIMEREFSMQRARRNPIASNAMMAENAKMA